MGIGVGYGEEKVVDAAKQAIMSPLLDTTIQGAKGIIFNVTGDRTCGLAEIEEAVKLIQGAADPQANIFIGADIDPNLEDEVRITVIATGFGAHPATAKKEEIRTSFKEKVDTMADSTGNFDGGKTIQPKGFDIEEDEEPELPVFLKKSPKRIRSTDD